MKPSGHRFVVDENGARVAVVLEMREYEKILQDMEELEAMRAFDSAIADPGEAVPFSQAVREIEQTPR